MSKKICFGIIFLLPVLTFSQVQKGDNFGTADGSFSYNHSKDDFAGDFLTKGFNFDYSLNWGLHHFVAKRIAIGPGFGFSVSNGESKTTGQGETVSKTTFTSISVGLTPSFRYYFCDSTKLNWFLGIEGICSYMWYKMNYTDSYENGDSKSNRLNWGGAVSLGSVYFITRNIGFEGQVSYMITETDNIGKGDPKNMILDQSVGISLGMMIYLGKHGG